MLAERKYKQKWALNPRATSWSKDNNRIGQKMLEKMGWSHGKGLGAKLDGITENIKVSYKHDSKGMGFKDSDGQWTEHENNFTALLQSLKQDDVVKETNDTVIKPASLEKKSQKSRARVHYHKFTRGKDLSRYSEKELANIFGKKSLKMEADIKPKQLEEKTDNLNGSSSNNSQFFYNSGSMIDYFKKKLPNFVTKPENTAENSESESEIGTSFGFGFNSASKQDESQGDSLKPKMNFISYVKAENGDYSESPSKKRKIEENAVNCTESDSKKKEKRKQKLGDESVGLSNPAFEPLFSTPRMEKHVLTTISEDNDENSETNSSPCNGVSGQKTEKILTKKEKKSKKRKDCDELNNKQDNVCFENNVREESLNKKEKKAKKYKDCDKVKEQDNPCFIEGDATENTDTIINNPHEFIKKVKKQKLKKGKENECLDNPCFNNNNEEATCEDEQVMANPYEVKLKTKHKKKNKRKNKDEFEYDNVNFNEELNEAVSNASNGFEIKRKEKKSKNKNCNSNEELNVNVGFEMKQKEKKPKNKLSNGLDNPALNTNDNAEINDQSVEVTESFEIKRKNKKSKKQDKQLESASENKNSDKCSDTTVEISQLDTSIECDLMLNVVSTPIIQKPVLKQPNSSSKKRRNVRFSDVNQEHIIPNNEELLKLEEAAIKNELIEIGAKIISNGINNKKDNGSYIEQNINSLVNKIDGCQAEVENDINEAKLTQIGQLGASEGEHEKLEDGTVKLKFKYAKFHKANRPYENRKSDNFAKKTYKHLIQGDVIMDFKDSNLHEIKGYGELH